MDEENKGLLIISDIKEVMRSIRKNIGCRFNSFNLTGPQGMIMGILSHSDSGKMKISDLSKKMGLSNSTVSGIIDRLEKQGLVERKRSDEDRRVVYVNVTEKFKKNFEDNFKNIQYEIEEIIKKTPSQDIQDILRGLRLLDQLINVMNKEKKKQ